MAEKDLLKLLEEKHPAEFTREQTDEMLARLGKSAKLRAALSRKYRHLRRALEEDQMGFADQRIDIYGLCAVANYVLTGRHAYPARSIQQLPAV